MEKINAVLDVVLYVLDVVSRAIVNLIEDC